MGSIDFISQSYSAKSVVNPLNSFPASRFANFIPSFSLRHNLNGTPGGKLNQLALWKKMGIIEGMESVDMIEPMPVWTSEESGTLNERARAWLDINCAHCHAKDGPAKNSGLHLGYLEEDPYRIGVRKSPVAAGRGSAGMLYSIVPGDPEKSILYQRINSLDPGIMMPELGRKTIHEEGVETIRNWIANLK